LGDAGSGIGDWWSNMFTTPTSQTPNWWETDQSSQVDQSLGPGTWGATPDAAPSYTPEAPQSFDWSNYDLFSSLTSPNVSTMNQFMPSDASGGSASPWLDKLGSKWAVPTALGLAGSLFQGSADSDTAAYKKKLLEAQNKGQAQGATDYINALQAGKDEAKSSYLQNTAGQKASLLERIGRSTADTGGANPRKVMEKFNRGANEGYGSFLLKLAQEKTAPLEAFTQQAMGNVDIPTEDWWTGFKRGTGSTLGTITGSMAQTNLLNSLLGKG
jgi:hypothetical protein